MWKQAIVVLATAAVASSFYRHYAFPQVVYMSPNLRSSSSMKYDCPSEGFYVNPQNCSQFYRCVDYTGTSQVFSVYVFECPRYHVFLPNGDNSTCVPGTQCFPGGQTAAHVASSTQKPSAPTTSGAYDNTGSTPRPVTSWTTPSRPVTTWPTTSRPATTPSLRPIPARPTTQAPVTPRPTVVNQPEQTPGPPAVVCRGQFVQHRVYCNVYYKCDNAGDMFLCPAGSVFDTVRQMCRIQGADENLCGGKSIYSQSGFRYSTDRVALGSSFGPFPVGQQQQYLQLPTTQFQPNYLAYFNPSHPLRRNPQQVAPLQYVQQRFTQGHSGGHTYTILNNNVLPHPEPESVHPRQFFVVDGDTSQYFPEPESVHPRQHFRVTAGDSSQYFPEPENVHPRQYFRVADGDNSQYRPEPELVHPRQYYVPIDSELDSDFY